MPEVVRLRKKVVVSDSYMVAGDLDKISAAVEIRDLVIVTTRKEDYLRDTLTPLLLSRLSRRDSPQAAVTSHHSVQVSHSVGVPCGPVSYGYLTENEYQSKMKLKKSTHFNMIKHAVLPHINPYSTQSAPIADAFLPTCRIGGAATRKESQLLKASYLQQFEVGTLVSVCLIKCMVVIYIPRVTLNVSNQTTDHFPQKNAPFPKEELGVCSNPDVGAPPEVEQQNHTPRNSKCPVIYFDYCLQLCCFLVNRQRKQPS